MKNARYGKLGLWRTGQWWFREKDAQFNISLNENSPLEVLGKDGAWHRVTWSTGPGGFCGSYADDREVKEQMEARLVE